MGREMALRVRAKVNFLLRVTGTDARGWHLLEMAAASVSLSDTVRVRLRADDAVKVRCGGVDEAANTAYKAACLFRDAFGTCGADIDIVKGIPFSAGLGGSSADAAAVLTALHLLHRTDDSARLRALAAASGGDVPYMMTGGFARIGGTGESVSPFDGAPVYHLVIAKPQQGISSADSYRMCDMLYGKNGVTPPKEAAEQCGALTAALCAGDLAAVVPLLGNDLFRPSALICPQILIVKALLEQFGASGAVMTGSGSGVAGLFPTAAAAEECACRIQNAGYEAYATHTEREGIVPVVL